MCFAQSLLESLERHDLEMKTAESVCERAPGRPHHPTSNFAEKVKKVKEEMTSAKISLNKYKTKLLQETQQWTAADQLRDRLNLWIKTQSDEIKQFEERPAKLHCEAATLEISHLEVSCYE